MKFMNIITLGMVSALIIGILLGMVGTLFYQDYIMERTLNGIYIKGNISYERANEISSVRDKKGDWVCFSFSYPHYANRISKGEELKK